MNKNRVYCGDCRELIKFLDSGSIDLIILDPPYLTTKEKWDKKEVVDYEFSKELFRVAKPNCSLYIWCGIGEKSQSLIRWFPIFNDQWHFKDLITWKKNRGIGMRKGWLYTREELMWFVKDNKKFVWNKEFQYSDEKQVYKYGFKLPNGKLARDSLSSEYKRMTNVWTDIKEILNKNTEFHYTPKPERAIERIIKVHTKENDLVLDCFAGSGVVGKICIDLNRDFILFEKEEEFVKYIKEVVNEDRDSV